MAITSTAPPTSVPRGHRAAVVCGVGSYLPRTVVSNHDLSRRLDTTDEWIRTRTGIRRRHRAAEGEATSDLAVEAGRRALDGADVSAVDAVIVATTTPDEICPATAPLVAARLGAEAAAAFDVSAVCTGFVYGLAAGAGLIATGTASRVLVVGADVYSSIVDPDDRGTAVIFGDGAGAVLLRAGDRGELGSLGPPVLGSDGSRADLIHVPAGGSRRRTAPRPEDRYFTMAGPEVFRHAVARMSQVSREALDAADWDVADVDRFVAHQANARILASVGAQVGLPPERQLSNIANVGNTGAASIPLVLDESAHDGTLRAGHRVVLTAFGGGLTWGALTLTWPELPARARDDLEEP